MPQYVIVAVTGFRAGNPNHRVDVSEPMPEQDAVARFARMRAGGADALRAERKAALAASVSDREFLVVARGVSGAQILDRYTLAEVL